jgi:hypothetical protein
MKTAAIILTALAAYTAIFFSVLAAIDAGAKAVGRFRRAARDRGVRP